METAGSAFVAKNFAPFLLMCLGLVEPAQGSGKEYQLRGNAKHTWFSSLGRKLSRMRGVAGKQEKV
jgi:hypothetical protein